MPGDPELRREVESLLAQDPAREGMLDRPAAALLEDSAVMTLAAGARLGPYQIEARIGAGGMGEVYRAHDSKLGRDVAIKVLPAKLVMIRNGCPLSARSANAGCAESSQHRNDPRVGAVRQRALFGDGVGPGRDACRTSEG